MRFDDIRNWASDRNLILGSTTDKQFLKLIEEVGEIAQGMAKNRPTEVQDGIGDVVVVLTILAAQIGVNVEDLTVDFEIDAEHCDANDFVFFTQSISDIGIAIMDNSKIRTERHIEHSLYLLARVASFNGLKVEDCIESAWNEIKDRKGRMVDGVYIKEGD